MNSLIEIGLQVPVRLDSTLCSRFRSTKSECAACAMVCPAPGAVRLGDGTGNNSAEINAACVGCGACVSACPNGAIRLLEDDQRVAERIAKKARAGEVFRFACIRAQVRADMVLPCLSRLTEALMLEPIRRDARRVELCAPDCSGCGLRKTAQQWERTLAFSQALCDSAGLGVARISSVQVQVGDAQEIRLPARTPNSRRRLFGAIAERLKSGGDERPVEIAAAGGTEPEAFRDIVQRHSENSKRTDLLGVLDALPGLKVTSKHVLAAAIPLGQLDVDQRCVACNVCETLCPTGALTHREEAGNYALEFDAAQCTGCRVCELACYHQALHLRQTVDLALLFQRSRVTLISARLTKCQGCGERILGNGLAFCPACQVSGDRRDSVARSFFSGGN
ncbi:MAG: 4Fe-4S binding protein [Rhodocyclales bacterium]|nr:4Fe-4S binding protein [Rhodocyclales bacterium]